MCWYKRARRTERNKHFWRHWLSSVSRFPGRSCIPCICSDTRCCITPAPSEELTSIKTELPTFMDFAYVAFTIGMTYQVSDTTLRSSQIRLAAFGHGLQAFVFGSMILATTVNLVAGLAR